MSKIGMCTSIVYILRSRTKKGGGTVKKIEKFDWRMVTYHLQCWNCEHFRVNLSSQTGDIHRCLDGDFGIVHLCEAMIEILETKMRMGGFEDKNGYLVHISCVENAEEYKDHQYWYVFHNEKHIPIGFDTIDEVWKECFVC